MASLRRLLLLTACLAAAGTTLLAAPDGLPRREVTLDLYSLRTGAVRQVVRYVEPPGAIAGHTGVCGVSVEPGVPDGKGLGDAAADRPPLVDLPGRSAPDVVRLAKGGRPLKVAGPWRALCLLVDFSDHLPTTYAGAAGPPRFQNMLFSLGTFASGSLAEYYRQVSYGQFTLSGEVSGGAAGWYRAPRTYAWYVNHQFGYGPYPRSVRRLVEDLVDLADPDVDYRRYDNDRDGYVDGLFIVHSGPGAESVAVAQRRDHLWSHKSQISDRVLDGVTISAYSMQPEQGEMGLFAHEFGHLLGLPDLYDTDKTSYGVGVWSLMGTGNWLTLGARQGMTPAHPDAWCKARLGWLQPTVVTQTGLVDISPAEDNRQAYALWKDGSPGKEYFLVENRQLRGFDQALPGTGLLIWHVDEDKYRIGNVDEWLPGLPRGKHCLLALEQADAQYDLECKANQGDALDPWAGLWDFTGKTRPNSDSYLAGDTGVAVTDIRARPRQMMRAKFSVSPGPLTAPTSVAITPEVPSPADTLTATASGASSPSGPVRYNYAWFVSTDGGVTYSRVLGADTNTVRATKTDTWQLWKAASRATDGTHFSAWTESDPVSVVPVNDDQGVPFRATWFADNHPQPAGMSGEDWQKHLQAADGKSWRTAFHDLGGAATSAQHGDRVLLAPGTYASGGELPGVTLTSRAPYNAATRKATVVENVTLRGPNCRVTGLTFAGEFGLYGGGQVTWCVGKLWGRPSTAEGLRVLAHAGDVWISSGHAGDAPKALVSGCAIEQLSVYLYDAAGADIIVRDNTIGGPVSVSGYHPNNPSPRDNVKVSFSRNTCSNGAIFGLIGSTTVADNTFTRGAVGLANGPITFTRNTLTNSPETGLTCNAGELVVSDNKITGAAGRGLVMQGDHSPDENVQVSGNTISGCRGGGVYIHDVRGDLKGNHILNNSVTPPAEPPVPWFAAWGGGICLYNLQGGVTSNEIRGNKAERGGGVYAFSCQLTSNRIVGNAATEAGGGVFSTGDGHLRFNTIAENKAPDGAGLWAAWAYWGRHNVITRNVASDNGGGVYLCYANGTPNLLSGMLITGNSATCGGGVYCGPPLDPAEIAGNACSLENNTVAGNTATHGAGVFGATGDGGPCTVYLKSCLITGNSSGGVAREAEDVTFTPVCNDVFGNGGGNYVDLADPVGRTGNLCVDPLYANPAGGDYHLRSVTGRWVKKTQSWVVDTVHSPAIDAGDPEAEFGDETPPHGSRVDLGCYGNSNQASRSRPSLLLSHRPVIAATDVWRDDPIELQFRWPVQESSAVSRLTLRPGGGAAVTGTTAWTTAEKVLTFRPRTPLLANTEYTLTVAAGVVRKTGQTIDWEESFYFTTGPWGGSDGKTGVSASACPLAGGSVQVTVSLSAAARVGLRLLNVAGREVAVVPERALPRGLSTVLFSGRSKQGTRLPAGTYLVQVTARGSDGTQAAALVMLRLER